MFLKKNFHQFFYETKNGISLKADDKMKIWEREKERNKKVTTQKSNIFYRRIFLYLANFSSVFVFYVSKDIFLNYNPFIIKSQYF